MNTLEGKVVIAGGASRGAGRGMALVLGEAGATVYVAARSPGVERTAREVTARGGTGIAAQADLGQGTEAAALFERVLREQGKVDVVTNTVWAFNVMPVWSTPFWQLPDSAWDETIAAPSAAWHLTVQAVRAMQGKGGLVIHVTDNPPVENMKGMMGQVLHDLGHEALNRVITGTASAARKAKVAVVGLNPGFMRTEAVLAQMTSDAIKRRFRFDLSESVEYIGRAACALAADRKVLRKAGQFLWVAELAEEYGFTDIDGQRIPRFDPSSAVKAFPA